MINRESSPCESACPQPLGDHWRVDSLGKVKARKCLHCQGIQEWRGSAQDLVIAHVDCDAFYAAVEKRDDPCLRDRPVIVGGGQRGVVATACYIARAFGVRSAMPMFKALRACPDAVVIRPDMAKYIDASHQIRALMEALTPLVQPVSIDEAYLDMTGTARLHGAPPVVTLARLQSDIARTVGVTVSLGLSYNKFLAKLASERDKPQGFAMITRADAQALLDRTPLSALPGVGPAFAKSLAQRGLRTGADVRQRSPKDMASVFGEAGWRLAQLTRGDDARAVHPVSARKSVSSETTFASDLRDLDDLAEKLWTCCERTAARAKAADVAGRGVTLKLKTASFALRTRSTRLERPTQMAHRLFAAARPLLAREADGAAFRLIGVGLTALSDAQADTDAEDLFDAVGAKQDAAERAMDAARAKFGAAAIVKGRSLTKPK